MERARSIVGASFVGLLNKTEKSVSFVVMKRHYLYMTEKSQRSRRSSMVFSSRSMTSSMTLDSCNTVNARIFIEQEIQSSCVALYWILCWMKILLSFIQALFQEVVQLLFDSTITSLGTPLLRAEFFLDGIFKNRAGLVWLIEHLCFVVHHAQCLALMKFWCEVKEYEYHALFDSTEYGFCVRASDYAAWV
jgi:hypothetical protein